jgi:hypothetical protein
MSSDQHPTTGEPWGRFARGQEGSDQRRGAEGTIPNDHSMNYNIISIHWV